jgi:lysophospholipase L1-like esterase
MKSPSVFIKSSYVALATALLIFSFTVQGQTAQPQAKAPVSARELNLLVLGDSVLWGQGLKEENKAWYLVKRWLEETDGVRVNEKVEAHAGAVIGTAGTSPPRTLTLYGEISSAWPTLHDQIDDALKSFPDPSQVDMVLVNGCINDVNARRFLNAANTAEGIQALAQEKCGAPVEGLLTRIASAFPNSHIIVSGYYPVVSEKTPRDLFMRALAKRFYAPIDPNGSKVSEKELLARLSIVSTAWYEASNRWIMDAVAKVGARLALSGSRQRVLFAKVPFAPEHAFAARDSRLWGFNASTLRKIAAVATLGWVGLHANDEVRDQRSSVCREFFKKSRGETEAQKRAREDQLMVCRLAAIAHPNRKGAVMYAEAMKEQVQSFLRNPGWLRSQAVSVGASP